MSPWSFLPLFVIPHLLSFPSVVVGNPSFLSQPQTPTLPSIPYAYVYILASKKNGTLYIGVCRDLIKRVYEHKNDEVESFTEKYQVHDLVYFEPHDDIHAAIQREKQLKKWNREWKIRLIEESNAEWTDLYESLLG